MPKIIELTVELDVLRVSCPGVWLCQDGRVSLTVYALGTNYQTCMLPPVFPLIFKDVFYFRKRYQESCALSNMCCLLKDETIYCELVQWSDDCSSSGCSLLAQYLGALNDVLFPPNMCSNDGVDLLMRRSKEFPGILSPKVEIATKVRIDEVWNQIPESLHKVTQCLCSPTDSESTRQKQVCHSTKYHRKKCYSNKCSPSISRSRTRSEAGECRSCCSLTPKAPAGSCVCPQYRVQNRPNSPKHKPRASAPPSRCTARNNCQQYSVYNVQRERERDAQACPFTVYTSLSSECDDEIRSYDDSDKIKSSLPNEVRLQKFILESRYIDENRFAYKKNDNPKKLFREKMRPCVCEICKRYHELFHSAFTDS